MLASSICLKSKSAPGFLGIWEKCDMIPDAARGVCEAQFSPKEAGAFAPWGKVGLPGGIERDNTAQREKMHANAPWQFGRKPKLLTKCECLASASQSTPESKYTQGGR